MLTDRFQSYVERHGLFSRDDRILLTVSGGVDSMVLLSLMASLGYRFGVAHCNFQLRGAESDEDEVIVAREAARYGVPCYNRRFDTAAEMERTGESMEMTARRLRYAWFEELRREHGYAAIAVAHHADDSIETFFINLLRGTGLRGLTGISTRMGRVVRPLMFASRREILEYAVAQKIPFREDSSNRSTKYLRNKIRLGLIPRIREINPKFTDLMRRNIERLTDTQLFIDAAVAHMREDVVTQADGIATIHVERIEAAYPRNFAVYELLSSQYGFKGDVCDALCRALSEAATGRRFYAREYVATVDRGRILVERIAPGDACEVTVEQGTQRSYCGNMVLYFEACDIDDIRAYDVPEQVALLDADLLRYPLRLRRWREGDTFIPFGMEGRKKVSDYLIDRKVSLPEKQRQFVLLSGDEIVWLGECFAYHQRDHLTMAKSAVRFRDSVAQFERLSADIAARRFAPVYLLMGDESYFIDALCDRLASTILGEAERSFNQIVLYGRDTEPGQVINFCRQMPMMGSYEVVILKEAQQMRQIEKLSLYTQKPQASTILVVCHKEKSVDKRSAFYKQAAACGAVFESVRPRDYEIGPWLSGFIASKGCRIDEKALSMLTDHLGCDVSKIANELEKLLVSLPEGTQRITDRDIERNIGISREYNNFELCKAVLGRDMARALRIADHFGRNPKENPLLVTVLALFGQFRQLFVLNYLYWLARRRGTGAPSDAELMRALKVGNVFAINELRQAMPRWPNNKVFGVLGLLREYDGKSKGLDAGGASDGELLRELLLKMLTI